MPNYEPLSTRDCGFVVRTSKVTTPFRTEDYQGELTGYRAELCLHLPGPTGGIIRLTEASSPDSEVDAVATLSRRAEAVLQGLFRV